MPLLPVLGGGFRLGPFFTKDCDFSCYYLEIIGTWSAKDPNLVATGTIRSVVTDCGIGADATAEIDPVGYPKSMRLKGFSWSANSGGVAIPDLVNASVDGVVLKLFSTYIAFPGIHGSELTLESDLAAK
jgi:hypothetical protein